MKTAAHEVVQQSLKRRVALLGSGVATESPAALLVAIAGATLWPVVAPLVGTGAAAGMAGGLAGLLSGPGQAWVGDFLARHATAKHAREDFERELAAQLETDDVTAAALRADVSALLRSVDGVEVALRAATDDLREPLVQRLAQIAAAQREFAWLLGAVAEPLAVIQDRQVESVALQRDQLALQREQLAKTNLVLQATNRRRAMSATSVEERGRPPPADVDCPYKGLASFGAEDEELFFGRETLIADVLARVAESPFLTVVGASGSGKSSLLHAGVLPALWRGALPASDQWPLVVLVPGRHPLRELAAQLAGQARMATGPVLEDLRADPTRVELAIRQVLARQPIGARCVLVVDQLEEAFTLCDDDEERESFLRGLASLGRGADRRAVVIVAMRADFFDRFLELGELAEQIEEHQLLVPAMDDGELHSAIVRPAKHVGMTLEPGLADMMLGDVGREPGALPLLAHALLETWLRREEASLTVDGYKAAGRVEGAIARTAESVFETRLSYGEREAARRVFLRLTEPGDGGEDTRRRVAMSELIADPAGEATIERVVDELVSARLVTAGATGVEVAHEALIRGWPRLRGWLDEDRAGRIVHGRLTASAAEWHEHERDDELLYRGPHLSEADAWESTRGPHLTPLERDFLESSRRRAHAERTAKRRRVQIAIAALGTALAVISVVAAIAVRQGNEAERQRDIAVSGELSAKAREALTSDPALGLSLAMRAIDVAATAQATRTVREATLAHRETALLRGHAGNVYAAHGTADGRRAVSGGADGTVRVWDLANRRAAAVHRFRHGQVFGARFSPDGSMVASAHEDGAVIVSNLDGRERRVVIRVARTSAYAVAFSPDGRRVAAPMTDGTVRVAATTGSGPPVALRGHRGIPYRAAFSSDGRRLVSGDDAGSAVVWDTATGAQLLSLEGHDGVVADARFSADDRLIVTAGHDGAVGIWDARTGVRRRFLRGVDQELTTAVLTADATRVLSAGEDGAIRLRDATDGSELAVLRGHSGGVFDVAFAQDEQAVISAGVDGTVRAWDLQDVHAMHAPVTTVAYSGDGRRVVSGGTDGTVRVWRAADGAPVAVLRGHTEPSWARLSPDGRRVVSASEDGTVRVWSVDGGRLERTLHSHRGPVWDAAFEPSGDRIASVGEDGRVVVTPVAGGQAVVLKTDKDSLYEVGFSPDGERVAAAGRLGAVNVWDVRRPGGPSVVLRGHHEPVNGVEFGPDGKHVASAGVDGTVRVWDLVGDEPVVLRGHDGAVESASFSPRGTRLVSAGKDGAVLVWDTSGGAPLVTLTVHRGGANAASFSPDGTQVVSSGRDDRVRIVECEVCGPFGDVVALAGSRTPRELTAAEQAELLPEGGS